jgi:hypothetical protein
MTEQETFSMGYELAVSRRVSGEDVGGPASPGTSISCQTYERLLAGETVSWNQILREHPSLGTMTVTQLVNAGVVQVTPDYDPVSGTADFYLTMHQPGASLQADIAPS